MFSSKMARSHNTTAAKDSKPLPVPTTPPVPDESPLPTPEIPPQRPSTSGTEAALTTSRRLASKQLRQAQRAERAYKAKKRSAAARANAAEARAHFHKAREHFKIGVRLALAVARGWPYMLREKREEKRRKRDEAERRRMEEKRRKLDERLGVKSESGEEAREEQS
ncbi:hypothetical protein VTK26DRAFT_8636 [Humicola hyalothermophila]